LKRVLAYLIPYKWRIALGLAIKFTGSVMDLVLPWILEYIIDEVIPLKNPPVVVLWGAVMLVCSGVALSFNVIANRMAALVARNTTERLRHDLFVKISYLSDSKIDEFSIPSLISRMTGDTYYVHRVVGMLQRIGIRAPILMTGGLILTFILDPVMALSLAVLLPMIFLLTYFITKKGVPLYTAEQEAQDVMIRVVRENAVGIRVIKALSKTKYERERFSKVNDKVRAAEMKAGATMSAVNPTMQLILNIGLVAVVVIGAFRVNAGVSQVGKIVAFLTYFTIIINAMMSITRIFTMYAQADASAKRIFEVLDTVDDLVMEEPSAPADANAPIIEFKNVSFSYLKHGYDLENVSFSLERGETLGIIGATGSGKTTLTALLMRLYDTDEGEILINGRNVKEYGRHELHEKFGVVFQNDVLFEDTVENNISFGRNISKEKVRLAARISQAAEFIENDKGYDGKVAIKGANLSGGQKQRLLIARAIAGDPEILILDDSSSALDYKTDSVMRREIRTHFEKTTSIIVAQRISSVMYADKIIVLDDGKIVGMGDHETLMKTCSEYAAISKLQLES